MSKIDEISSKSKASILEHLKKAYKETDFTRIESIDPVEHIQTTQDMLTEMKQKMSDNKYIVENATKDTLEEKINEIVAKYGFKSMIYGADLNLDLEQIKAEKKICFDKEIENLRSEVFHSDFSIIHARAGVSSHGVALIPSSKTQPRMLSLAPKLCVVLLKKENVVKSLSEALNLVKKKMKFTY